LNIEDEPHERFPFIFKIPPVTVKVPLFVNGVLFKVHPTVKSPEAITSVAPEFMVKFLETLEAELIVTVYGDAIITISLHVGTVPLLQVDVAFQFPDAIDVIAVVATVIVELLVLLQVPFVVRTR
jgi:hypothetical protein